MAQQCLELVAKSTPRSVYVHLPFCKRKCFYCDFPVQAVGLDSTKNHVQDRMKQYINATIDEINCSKILNEEPLQTVFFGGGTPSLLPSDQLSLILQALRNRFGISKNAEISMEADPGTFTLQSLQEYMSLGVTRFSVGVQAFQQEMLEKCGRSHNLDQVYEAIRDVKEAGPSAWSLDLISGLPDLSFQMWQESINCAIKEQPDHISIYDLQIEDQTPFGRWYEQGKLNVPNDDTSTHMYKFASTTLRDAGFEHYEVSNYAKAGKRCQHNLVYWDVAPFYAFGLGAASYLSGRRYSRPKKMNDYYKFVEKLKAENRQNPGGVVPGSDLPQITQEDLMLDFIMLRCRLKDGIHLQRFEEMFGKNSLLKLMDSAERFVSNGLVEILDDQQFLRLKDPDGWLVSNDIISTFFAALSQN
eukprot:TRINITY_DN8011_c1_g1_i1.p1 TRINITY_DN8011_c1_g1~~TRINITY_DN8011_c1_g1_i1.p1  ORF type:complete len:415 (-),score=48.05 TRINITY_DN8011_c1_g1_i1:149-1393(-)